MAIGLSLTGSDTKAYTAKDQSALDAAKGQGAMSGVSTGVGIGTTLGGPVGAAAGALIGALWGSTIAEGDYLDAQRAGEKAEKKAEEEMRAAERDVQAVARSSGTKPLPKSAMYLDSSPYGTTQPDPMMTAWDAYKGV